jgi:hypothetical protein
LAAQVVRRIARYSLRVVAKRSAAIIRASILFLAVTSLVPGRARPESNASDTSFALAMKLRDENRLPDAIRMLEEIHQRSPGDNSVARILAETLAWAGQTDRAMRAFTALAADGDSASMLSIALLHAWADDLGRSADEYRALAAAPSLRSRATLGLARVRFWQGRYRESSTLIGKSLELGMRGPEWNRLSSEISEALDVRAIARSSFVSDSDHNHRILTETAFSGPFPRDIRYEGRIGFGSVERGNTRFRLTRGEIAFSGRIAGIWAGSIGGGIENRDPGPGPVISSRTTDRTQPFGQAAVRGGRGRWRISATIDGAHPSDTVDLVASAIRTTSASAEGGWLLNDRISAEAGGGGTAYSDGNRRRQFHIAIKGTVVRHPMLTIGFAHRSIANDLGAPRPYFSPTGYRSDEVQFGVAGGRGGARLRYALQLSTGLQRVERGSRDTATGFHSEASFLLTRRLEIMAGGGWSNSALQSASGYSFRTGTIGAVFHF